MRYATKQVFPFRKLLSVWWIKEEFVYNFINPLDFHFNLTKIIRKKESVFITVINKTKKLHWTVNLRYFKLQHYFQLLWKEKFYKDKDEHIIKISMQFFRKQKVFKKIIYVWDKDDLFYTKKWKNEGKK